MTEFLDRQISEIRTGDHLCLLYEQAAEALPLAARFLREGLDRGEHGFYVIDDHSRGEVIAALEAEGVAVEEEVGRGRLRFLTAREYCPLESFEPQAMLARFRALGDELASSGIPAARAAVEMTWALSVGAPLDLLAEYECWGNHIFEHFTGMSLCMYNRRRFPAAAMERLLRAHPIVAMDGDIAPNPFYEPPEIYFAEGDRSGERFALMLERLRAARQARRDREEVMAQLLQDRAAREEAEKASAQKSRFLAVTSHELRTPLNAIIGYHELLAEGIAGPLNASQRGYLERIDVSARHLLGLIDQLLEAASLEVGEEEVRSQELDAGAMLREVADLVRPDADRRRLELETSVPEEPLVLATDPGKLRQILLNLASNAVKYTDSGGVRMELAPDGEGGALFTVSDTGIGMAEADLERAFQPFTQVHEEQHHRGGTGLGLAVSRGLAGFLGATLTAESALGVGSSFTLAFAGAPQQGASGDPAVALEVPETAAAD
jgi:signal transduction histidine kinase